MYKLGRYLYLIYETIIIFIYNLIIRCENNHLIIKFNYLLSWLGDRYILLFVLKIILLRANSVKCTYIQFEALLLNMTKKIIMVPNHSTADDYNIIVLSLISKTDMLL